MLNYLKHAEHLAQTVYKLHSTLRKPQCVILGQVLLETINTTTSNFVFWESDADQFTRGTLSVLSLQTFSNYFEVKELSYKHQILAAASGGYEHNYPTANSTTLVVSDSRCPRLRAHPISLLYLLTSFIGLQLSFAPLHIVINSCSWEVGFKHLRFGLPLARDLFPGKLFLARPRTGGRLPTFWLVARCWVSTYWLGSGTLPGKQQ